MPINKNAQMRYKILDRCFSNFYRKYQIDELRKEVEDALKDMYGQNAKISTRQIREDIRYMRDSQGYNAPIIAKQYEGKKCFYRYEDPDFSIFNINLKEEEMKKLEAALEIFSRFNGGQNSWLQEMQSKIEYEFGFKANKGGEIEFEQNAQLKGIEHLSALMDVTIQHISINLTYRSFKGNERTSVFHPYYLKQFNNRWFLFGLEENEKYGNKIINKALDRIVRFEPAKEVTFIQYKDGKFRDYFKDIVGVTVPDDYLEPEQILLKFNPSRFPYVVSKPIHHSQNIESEENCIVSLKLRPNQEFEAQLFSFGPDVEVLKPESLRQSIANKIKLSLEKYI